MTHGPNTPESTTARDIGRGIAALLDFILYVSLWVIFLYSLIDGDMVWLVGTGIILIIMSLYDIKSKEGGRIRP